MRGGKLNQDSIFAVTNPLGATRFLRNRLSLVALGSSQKSSGTSSPRFQFRNPPSFMPTVGDQLHRPSHGWSIDMWQPWAEAEQEALIDHLFEHDNTPPFVAHALLQVTLTVTLTLTLALALAVALTP